MREFDPATLRHVDAHGARYALADGELVVRVLEHAIVRVAWRPAGG
jgi:hypothetical protein